MGRISKLRKQRRQGNSTDTRAQDKPVVHDVGNAWVKVNGVKPLHVQMMANPNYIIQWECDSNTLLITVPHSDLGQFESMAILAPCESPKELGLIRQLLAQGFSVDGFPLLQKRFWCDATERWVVPVAIYLRQFYSLQRNCLT